MFVTSRVSLFGLIPNELILYIVAENVYKSRSTVITARASEQILIKRFSVLPRLLYVRKQITNTRSTLNRINVSLSEYGFVSENKDITAKIASPAKNTGRKMFARIAVNWYFVFSIK